MIVTAHIDIDRSAGADESRPYEAVLAELSQLRADLDATVRLATHDPLTGLPNRRTIAERLEEGLSGASDLVPVAVLFVDVDRFKLVNDLYGHEVGDRVLTEIATRLRCALGDGDDLARLGGDEFVVLCRRATQANLAELVSRINTHVGPTIDVGHRTLPVSVSVGVALAGGALDPEDLIAEADAAMYRAKRMGRGSIAYFDETMQREFAERADLERDLSRALQDGQLTVHYQPTYDLATRAIVGLEALVRWNHPRLGVLPANRFVPLAEDVGEVWAIDTFVLSETSRQLARWQEMSPALADLTMAVNLSAQQLRDSNVVRTIGEALDAASVDPATFQLEICESTMTDERSGSPLATLRELDGLGVKLAVDNFGTASSPLSALKQLPVGAVNIDRSFTAGAGTNGDDEAILRAIIGLADAFGIDAVAEGVETAQQLEWLRAAGCRTGQGYLLSRPLTADQTTALLSS